MAIKPKTPPPLPETETREYAVQGRANNINPEIDSKINEFIAQNPKLVESIRNLPDEVKTRRLLKGIIEDRDQRVAYSQAVQAKLDTDPNLKNKVDTFVQNVPVDKLAEARLSAAKQLIKMEGTKLSVGKPKFGVSVPTTPVAPKV